MKLAEFIPQVDVPEGTWGGYEVERFTVDRDQAAFANFRSGRRPIMPGTYTRLVRGGMTTMMSDTPMEIMDHFDAVRNAKGHCLIAGLGLGVVVQAALLRPEVTRVTVVEEIEEIIALVGYHYKNRFGDRLEIVEHDIFTYPVGKDDCWDMAWFDIWDSITSDNLEEIKYLKCRFPPHKCGWRGFWCEAEHGRQR